NSGRERKEFPILLPKPPASQVRSQMEPERKQNPMLEELGRKKIRETYPSRSQALVQEVTDPRDHPQQTDKHARSQTVPANPAPIPEQKLPAHESRKKEESAHVDLPHR